MIIFSFTYFGFNLLLFFHYLLKLRKAQAETRKQLKNVRKELTADIDSLGLTLKCINIGLIPALVVLFGLFRGFIRKRG